jgi:hypothetical protein
MPYKSFTIKQLKEQFHLQEAKLELFPAKILPLEPSPYLVTAMERAQRMPLLNENSKSEWIIAPILSDVWNSLGQSFSIFSGVNLKADVKNNLVGECDFVISHQKTHFLEASVFALVEAKSDNIDNALGQCAAQMLGARVFNHKENVPIETIYGCVTNSDEWRFLKLKEQTIILDTRKYYLSNLPELLGILRYIINQYVSS